jgi:hypothetical protein
MRRALGNLCTGGRPIDADLSADVLALGRKRQLDSTAWTSGIWQFVKQLAPVLRSWLVTDAAVSQFHLLSVLLRSVSVSLLPFGMSSATR